MKEQSNPNKRNITPAEKRDLMWNIIQPGDPYDIRKSMIASLPGQTKFMGPHLELVCLLQAAEIERLCLFLEEHKVKLRQNERLDLDRHSYEVQIKELTEKIVEFQNLKRQNEKLKEYIRKQTVELEQLQKQQNNIQLTTKYENSLRQIHTLIQEKEDLEEITRRQGAQISSLKQLGKMNEQAKSRQLEIINRELKQMNESKLEQDQLFKQKTNKWDSQRRRLQIELGSITKKYEEMAEAYRLFQAMNQTLKRELEKTRYQALRAQQYKKTFGEYEERFVKVGEEITRLNDLLKEKARTINEHQLKNKQLSESIRLKDQQLAENQQAINELQISKSILQRQQREAQTTIEKMAAIIKTYEASLQKYIIEVDRLSGILLKSQADTEHLKHKNAEYERQIGILQASERQKAEYKIKYGQIINKLTEAELDNTHLSQEIQRLNLKLKKELQERNLIQIRSKNYESQFENLKSTIATLSSEFDRKNIERQSQIKGDLQAQIQRLNNIIEQSRQINLQNEEKLGYFLRQIKLLESQLHDKQGFTKIFRSIYDSSEELKGKALSPQQKEEYAKDLQKKIKQLSIQLHSLKVSSPRRSQASQQVHGQRKQARQGQVSTLPTDEVQRLKDQLLNKQIQNNRLTQINEQLREKLHNYKRRTNESPYSQERGNEKIGYSPKSAGKQITRIQKQTIKPPSARQRDILIEQEVPITTEQNQYERPTDVIYRQGLDVQVQPHKILDKSKQKKRSLEKLESDYPPEMRQYSERRQYTDIRQQPARREQSERRQESQRREEPKSNQYSIQKEYSERRDYPSRADFPERRDYPQRERSQRIDYIERIDYQQRRDDGRNQAERGDYFPQRRGYPETRGYPQRGVYPAGGRIYPEQRGYPEVNDQPQRRDYPERREHPYSQAQRIEQNYSQKQQRSRQQHFYEKAQKQIRQEQRKKIFEDLETIVKPATFKQLVQQEPQNEATPQVIQSLKHNYNKMLTEYQKLIQSCSRLKGELVRSQQENQLNESYIVRLTDNLELLNNQISHLRQRIDPRAYQEAGQTGQLQRSYSLLLQKYNSLMYDNEELRSRLANKRVQGGQSSSGRSDQAQIRRLYAQNEELKRNCATFSQYYNKIMMVNDELERVNKILFERDRQIHQKDILIRDLQIEKLGYQKKISQMDSSRVRDPKGQSKISLPLSIQREFTIQKESDKVSRQLVRLQKRNSDLQKIVKGYELDEPKATAAPNDERRHLQGQIESMSAQIARLNNLLGNKKKDIEVLQQQNRSLLRNVDEGKRSSRVYQDNSRSMTKYEEKIVLLSQEIERLNGLLRIKEQNYSSLRLQYSELQNTAKQKLTSYAKQVDRLNQELSSIRVDLDRVRSKDGNGKQPASLNNISDYQAKMVQLAKQVDRLNRILVQNRQQISQFNAKQSKYRSEIQRLNNSLRIKVEESIMSETKQKIVLEERKVLNRQLQEKSGQSQALGNRYRILEQENSRFKHHIGEYQKRIKGCYEQCERLQKIIKYLKGEKGQNGEDIITQLIEKNRFLLEQIERLNSIVEKQNLQLSEIRLSLADQSSLQKRINEDLALFVVLFAEIESLRNRVIQKEAEMQQVRRTSIAARKF